MKLFKHLTIFDMARDVYNKNNKFFILIDFW